MDQKGKEDTPQPSARTSMTGLVGTAVIETLDDEGMTVILSADGGGKMTIREKAFVCGRKMNGDEDGWMAGVAACHPADAQGQRRLTVTPSGWRARHRDDNDERLSSPNSQASWCPLRLSSLCHLAPTPMARWCFDPHPDRVSSIGLALIASASQVP